MTEATTRSRWTAWVQTEQGQAWIKRLRNVFLVGIVAFLGYRLTMIGWGEIWSSLPRVLWFYVLWLLMYAVLPVVDTLAYRWLWGLPFWRSLPVLMRKRVFSSDVLNYSGEVYFYFWARDRVDQPRREVLKDIRDNTILSSLSSTLISFALLGLFVALGPVALPFLEITAWPTVYVVIGVVILAVLIAAGIRFRKYLFALPAGMAARLFALHCVRLIIIMGLQVAQWAVVWPEVPVEAWGTLLAAQIVVNQIPFIPSKDLLFVGVGVEMSSLINVSAAAIAALLLAKSVLDKLANLIVFIFTSNRSTARPESLEGSMERAPTTHPEPS